MSHCREELGIVSWSLDPLKCVTLFTRPCCLPLFNSLVLFLVLLDEIHQHRFLYADIYSFKGEKTPQKTTVWKNTLLKICYSAF